MGSVGKKIQRLDLLNGDLTFNTTCTIAHDANLTMSLKVRQHGLGAPAVMALESGSVDLIQLLAWVLADVAQHGTLSK